MEKEYEDTFVGSEKKWKDAVKLSFEALKRELNNRSGSKYVIVAPLKGETKE